MQKQVFTFTIASCFLAIAIWGCSEPQPPATNSKADEAAIRQADLDWSKAAEAADWSDSTGFFSFLLDDAVYLPPNEPIWSGKAAVKEKLNPFFSTPGFSAKWEPSQVSVSGDLGYTVGNYDMLMTDSTGAKSVVENGKYLVIWKRQADGKWKVAAESFNSDMPLPEPPAN
jgi:ketosteroid isomerase-like protein